MLRRVYDYMQVIVKREGVMIFMIVVVMMKGYAKRSELQIRLEHARAEYNRCTDVLFWACLISRTWFFILLQIVRLGSSTC